MKRSILIVESSKALQYLITTILEPKYVIKSVQNSRHAMQLFSSGYEADLVLLDIPNFETENFELMDHILTSSIFSQVPVLVLSTNRSEALKNSCLEAGVTDFLTKPFDPVFLLERVNQLLAENTLDVLLKRRNRIFNNLNIF
jgi:CheY-like chemotaxis protein